MQYSPRLRPRPRLLTRFCFSMLLVSSHWHDSYLWSCFFSYHYADMFFLACWIALRLQLPCLWLSIYWFSADGFRVCKPLRYMSLIVLFAVVFVGLCRISVCCAFELQPSVSLFYILLGRFSQASCSLIGHCMPTTFMTFPVCVNPLPA